MAFDGAKHTVTNYVYTKTSAPAKTDFHNELLFNNGGFSSGYTLMWKCAGEATKAGTDALKGTETLASTPYLW